MTVFASPGAFAIFLQQALTHASVAAHEGVIKGGEIIRDEAKAEIGHYQGEAAPFKAWDALAERTKKDRVRKGFSEDEPLLRTGGLRDSIEVVAEGAEASVGSALKVALYQEMGTEKDGSPHIPPRSFLGGAAVRKQDEAINAMAAPTVALLVHGKL